MSTKFPPAAGRRNSLLIEADEALTLAMGDLASDPRVIFVGQNVAYDGNVMFKHLANVPQDRRLELPVCEELQLGMSIGLALTGFIPVSIYPRFDFLLLAANQLVNHLDKLPGLSNGQWQPKVIIRTKVGSKHPLDAGPQHTQDHTAAFTQLLQCVTVLKIVQPYQVFEVYHRALNHPGSFLIVEALT